MTATLPLDFHSHFFNLQDPRCSSRSDFRLLDLVFIALCATIAGADDWQQIETWASSRKDWLARFCRLPEGNRTPSHDTLERLFKRLDPAAFARCFGRWTAALAGGLGLKQIALDGKCLRGSGRRGGQRALHLVQAWATENRLCLGQVAVETKSNEITAIPTLLELLELKGALVSIDAMGCQKAIAAQIVDGGGDYVLPVKANQEKLLKEIQWSFEVATALDFEGVAYDYYEEEVRGHGRVERRSYIVLYGLGLISEREKWKGLSAVGLCIREREENGKRSVEDHYFMGSRKMAAKGYAGALRGHWGIENNLHWQLDVTFGEDANRVANRNAAQNLALLRRFAAGVLKRHPSKKSMANKRYKAALDVAFLEEILHITE